MEVNTVTVIGASGTMGANVAALFAGLGRAKVFCVGRDTDKLQHALDKIKSIARDYSIEGKLLIADESELEECVRCSDLVFESVPENIVLKSQMAERIGSALRPGSVSCTGSSGLSITEIAAHYPPAVRGSFFGVHLFNPPYQMSLCEFTATKYTDAVLAEKLKNYLKTALHRTVVEVTDSPAFLGNRIGFQSINFALQQAERFQDKGGIDYIDAILGKFTGRAAPPLVTSNFVGLDIHKAIVDNLRENTDDYLNSTFRFPDFAARLVESGCLGRKTGQGLYKTVRQPDGSGQRLVWDIREKEYRPIRSYDFPFVRDMKAHIQAGDYRRAYQLLVKDPSPEAEFCLKFLLQYIRYSLYTAGEVSFSPGAADDVMAAGFHWCPPIALYELLSEVCDVRSRMLAFAGGQSAGKPEGVPENLPASAYDYRQYIRC